MRDELIRMLVDRFLAWKLPEDFKPDAGISFKPTFNEHLSQPMKYEPTGTNLFTADQARQMFEYLLAELSPPVAQQAWRDAALEEAAKQVEANKLDNGGPEYNALISDIAGQVRALKSPAPSSVIPGKPDA